MGLLDTIEGMAGQQSQGTNASVAGGLMQALDEHPGGLAGVISSFENNGMASHVQQWSTGQQTTATPDQIQQGLGGTDLIDRVAAKAGVSSEVAKIGMAVVLPLVMSHFTHGGQQTAPQNVGAGGFSGLASQILGKIV